MARSKRMTDELLEQVNLYIRSLPTKGAKGQAEAAEFLSPAFRFAMKRGYSLDEIQGLVFNEFGLTLQKSKLKKAVAANENAKAGVETALTTKGKKQKQTDTPPATDKPENGTVDADTLTANAGGKKSETQTDETSPTLQEYQKDFASGTEAMSASEKARQILASESSAEKPPVKRGGFEIVPDTPLGEL